MPYLKNLVNDNLVNNLYSNCSRSNCMKKFFDWLNNWFDNANLKLDIVSEELKQKKLEALQRSKELEKEIEEKYGLTPEELDKEIEKFCNRK